MNKMKVNEFRELSRIGEIGELTINGKFIKYKKYLPYTDKLNIVYTVLENAFDPEENIYNRISLDTTLKYMILVNYIDGVNFPRHKVGDEMLNDVEEIINIGISSGIYKELVENIEDDYNHIMELLQGKIEESNETKHFSNMMSKIINQISELDEGKLDDLADKVKNLDAFRSIE
jgi:soluble cytochrome b562